MVQLRNQKLVFHTLKETSVDFHRQFQTNHHHLSSNFNYAYEVMYPFRCSSRSEEQRNRSISLLFDFHRQFQTNHHHLSSNFIYAYEVMYPFISRFIPYK